MLVELGLVEQRYQPVLEVLNNASTVTDVAVRFGVTSSGELRVESTELRTMVCTPSGFQRAGAEAPGSHAKVPFRH